MRTYVVVVVLVALAMPGLAGVHSPSITILPDKNFAPNEKETVKGNEFPANGTAKIDLIMPSGSTMEGVAYAQIDGNGTFTATFTAPNTNGDGYVRASSGTVVVSELVHFTGSGAGDLTISVPASIYTNDTTIITIASTTLTEQNYIIDLTVTNPSNSETTKYFVLHNGLVYADWVFTEVGTHKINALVEGVNTTAKTTVNVRAGNGGGGTGGTGGNITWITTKSGKNLIIMLDTGTSFIETGSITVISPSGNVSKIAITDGVATLPLTEAGAYILRYTSTSGQTTSKTYTYSPSVSISASVSTTTGKISITIYVDNSYASGNVRITNSVSGTEDYASLTNGRATYTPSESGVYRIIYSYAGKEYSRTVTWSDTPTIDQFDAWISGDKVVLSGMISGKYSGEAMSGVRVTLTTPSGKIQTTTDSSGEFEETFDASRQGRYFSRTTLTFKATVGTESKKTSVDIEKDFWADWWWGVLLLLVLGFAYIYKTGLLYKWTKGAMGVPSMRRGHGTTPRTPFTPAGRR